MAVLCCSGSGPPVDKSEPTTGRGRGRARRMYSPGEKCGAHVVLCLLLRRRRLRRCDCAVIIHRREGRVDAVPSGHVYALSEGAVGAALSH